MAGGVDFPRVNFPDAMTYARKRLWLGISAVGATVLLAAGLLLTRAPLRVLPTHPGTPFIVHLAHLVAALAAWALLFLPLDVLGGVVLVRERPPFERWLMAWLRGAGAQLTVFSGVAALLLLAGRAGGPRAAWFVVVLLSLFFVMQQARIARLVAEFTYLPLPSTIEGLLPRSGLRAADLRLVRAEDSAFVGGWAGLGAPTLWLPAAWAQALDGEALTVQLLRRHAVRQLGLRRAGVLVALAWTWFGAALALSAPDASAVTAGGLATSALWFTLWEFAGVLLLPSVSRPAVLACDRWAVARAERDLTARTLRWLDERQEDEPERGALVNTVFHPVPSLGQRLRGLDGPASPSGAWQAARLSLFTGWAGLGLLGRAVHCNIGRPELWVFLPGD